MSTPTADQAQIAQYRQFAADPDAIQHYGEHQPERYKSGFTCQQCYSSWPCLLVQAYSDGLRAAARDLLVHLDRAAA